MGTKYNLRNDVLDDMVFLIAPVLQDIPDSYYPKTETEKKLRHDRIENILRNSEGQVKLLFELN